EGEEFLCALHFQRLISKCHGGRSDERAVLDVIDGGPVGGGAAAGAGASYKDAAPGTAKSNRHVVAVAVSSDVLDPLPSTGGIVFDSGELQVIDGVCAGSCNVGFAEGVDAEGLGGVQARLIGMAVEMSDELLGAFGIELDYGDVGARRGLSGNGLCDVG